MLRSVKAQGYELCACGELELTPTFFACGGVCYSCYSKGVLARVARIEIIERARRMSIPVPSPHKKKKKKQTPRRHLTDHARRAALKRLRLVYPETYELFYADERMKRDLPPTVRRESSHLSRAVETYEAGRGYSRSVNLGEADAVQPQGP